MALLVSNALAGIVPWARVPAVLTATSPILDRVAALAAFTSDIAFEIKLDLGSICEIWEF